MIWLGRNLGKRGILLHSQGMPSYNTVSIGLEHLKDYINIKRDYITPKVTPGVAYANYLMLWYYRNPLNFVFFNEGLVICSVLGYGNKMAWN